MGYLFSGWGIEKVGFKTFSIYTRPARGKGHSHAQENAQSIDCNQQWGAERNDVACHRILLLLPGSCWQVRSGAGGGVRSKAADEYAK